MTNIQYPHLDTEAARKFGVIFADSYNLNTPFPHVVIDNFLPHKVAKKLVREFPAAPEVEHHLYEIGYRGSLKRQYSPEKCSAFCRQFFMFLNSGPFLEFLETLSSCKGLIGDPYFEGGGFHETLSKGMLGIHRDFRINKRLNLLRKINLILYLNEGWQKEFGGMLELWSRDMKYCEKQIEPIFNRCVIFSTDESSFHGHPEPLLTPLGITRRSISTYYYTASEKIFEDIKGRRTYFVARPGEDSKIVQELHQLQNGET